MIEQSERTLGGNQSSTDHIDVLSLTKKAIYYYQDKKAQEQQGIVFEAMSDAPPVLLDASKYIYAAIFATQHQMSTINIITLILGASVCAAIAYQHKIAKNSLVEALKIRDKYQKDIKNPLIDEKTARAAAFEEIKKSGLLFEGLEETTVPDDFNQADIDALNTKYLSKKSLRENIQATGNYLRTLTLTRAFNDARTFAYDASNTVKAAPQNMIKGAGWLGRQFNKSFKGFFPNIAKVARTSGIVLSSAVYGALGKNKILHHVDKDMKSLLKALRPYKDQINNPELLAHIELSEAALKRQNTSIAISSFFGIAVGLVALQTGLAINDSIALHNNFNLNADIATQAMLISDKSLSISMSAWSVLLSLAAATSFHPYLKHSYDIFKGNRLERSQDALKEYKERFREILQKAGEEIPEALKKKHELVPS